MQTINTIKTFPNGTPIDAVQCRISKAYEYKNGSGNYGPYTVQKAVVEDGSGNKIELEAWDHPDLAKIEGQEVVVHASSRGKGLEVKHDSYVATKGEKAGQKVEKVYLKLGKHGQLQHVAVFHQSAGTVPAPSTGQVSSVTVTNKSANVEIVKNPDTCVPSAYHPATAGLATNKAIDVLIAAGYDIMALAKEGKLAAEIVALGSQIALGALSIEKGTQIPPVKQNLPKAKETAPAVNPVKDYIPNEDGPDKEIPF